MKLKTRGNKIEGMASTVTYVAVALVVAASIAVVVTHPRFRRSPRPQGQGRPPVGRPPRVVPARIVQTWKTLDLGMLAPAARTWREWNPGFAYTLFDDEACARFIRERIGPRVAAAYAKIKSGAFRADLWRYCELYVNGGVYVDVDTVCLNAVDDVIDPTATLVVPIDLDPANLFNAFVAVAPAHPVMRMCIDAVVDNVERGRRQAGLGFSGPGLLGSCVAAYIGSAFEVGVPIDGVQFLRFEPGTEIVSNAAGMPLMQNKNGSREIYEAYEAEARRAAIVRYDTGA